MQADGGESFLFCCQEMWIWPDAALPLTGVIAAGYRFTSSPYLPSPYNTTGKGFAFTEKHRPYVAFARPAAHLLPGLLPLPSSYPTFLPPSPHTFYPPSPTPFFSAPFVNSVLFDIPLRKILPATSVGFILLACPLQLLQSSSLHNLHFFKLHLHRSLSH